MNNYRVIAGESNIELIEEYFGKDKNTFPWEWFFILCLQNVELDMNADLAHRFVIFVKEFYPEFKWINFDVTSWVKTVQMEAKFCGMAFSNMTEHHSPNSIALPHAREFGSIVREFLIRYRSYTFIREEDKTIFTAIDKAHDVFSGYLSDGYRLELLDKLNWVTLDSSDGLLNGVFSPFPKNIGARSTDDIETTKQDLELDTQDIVIPDCRAR